ncbi:hypothetical protein DL96DRAFT_1596039 [Flagelloscypha sp. PMI_526]|nr:hypothetical protein DL96DRAFT_1596039 [Flagelloscypha sp. PMI_526]
MGRCLCREDAYQLLNRRHQVRLVQGLSLDNSPMSFTYTIPVSYPSSLVTATPAVMTVFATETRWDPAKLTAQPFYQIFTNDPDQKYFEGYVVGETGADGKFNYGGTVPVQTVYFESYGYKQLYTYAPSPTPTSFDYQFPETWVECHGPSPTTILYGTETATATPEPPSAHVCYNIQEAPHSLFAYPIPYTTLATRTLPVMAVATMFVTTTFTSRSTMYSTSTYKYSAYGGAATGSSSSGFSTSSHPTSLSTSSIVGIVLGVIVFMISLITSCHRMKMKQKKKEAEAAATAVNAFGEGEGKGPSTGASAAAAAASPTMTSTAPATSVTSSSPAIVGVQQQPVLAYQAPTPSAAGSSTNPSVYEHRVNMMQEEIQELREQIRRRDNTVAADPPPGYSPV